MSHHIPPTGTPYPLPLSAFLAPTFPGFRVEAYQRAYKWQSGEVEALLRDIWTFTPSAAEESYCLQPIVVCRDPHDEGPWELIDGQQRITTVYLILCFLGAELGRAPYTLRYRTRRATERLVRRIPRWRPQPPVPWEEFSRRHRRLNNADTFHLHEAWQTIAAWFAEKADGAETVDRHVFLRKLQTARVIWYEPAAGREGARGVFQRLNSGKLPLEDAELVKALFLRSREETDVPAPWQLEIAREWDQIEAGLRDDRFWQLINPSPRHAAPVRIGFIFDLVCRRGATDEERYFCYYHYVRRFGDAEKAGCYEAERELAWLEVKSCYAVLREWLDDPMLYHLTGFITSARQKFASLADLFRECRQRSKSGYQQWLRALVQRYGSGFALGDLSYENEHHKARLYDLLLLFNLVPLMEKAAATRFRFDLFHEERWSLEHIHAQASRALQETEWPLWLDEQRALLAEIDPAKNTRLVEELEAWETLPSGREKTDRQAQLEEDLARHFAEHFAADELHGLGNLALLSSRANSALGNRPFAVKRQVILEMNRAGHFVPLETVNVFLKSYSTDPTTFRHWSRADRREYLDQIGTRLEPFRADARPDLPSAPPRPHPLPPASLRADSSPAGAGRIVEATAEQESFSRLTFWLLLERWRVEIPLIQRDYAQGRENDPRAKQIRDDFIRRLFAALRAPGGVDLDLDLMFGKYVGSRLIPLDGQQRLTTLFLLHWLLAKRSGSAWAEARRRLERFSYETRTSSRDFCRALCLEEFELFPGAVCSQLEDQPWFVASWRHDATVRAMLRTLDSLQAAAEQAGDAAALGARLTAPAPDAPIYFHFLTLGALGVSDDLYLRLNARGRPLNDFENFKAWLGGQHPCIEEKLDTRWADFFWQLASDRERSDAQHLQFFKGAALNETLADSAEDEEKLVALFIQPYVSTDQYADGGAFSELRVARLRSCLDLLSGGAWAQKRPLLSRLLFLPSPSLLARFVSPDVEFRDRALFHSFSRAAGQMDDATFLRWMRVCRNLLNYTEVNAATLARVIRAVETMAAGLANIHAFLARCGDSRPAGLGEYQWQEECLKARLIHEDPAWEKPLEEAEDHGWFRGQIRFLFTTRDGHTLTLEEFEHRSAKARAAFADDGWIARPDSLFQRALLSLHDYARGSHPNYGLGRRWNDEWRDWLRDEEMARKVWDLLDPLRIESFESDLHALCSAYSPRDWRWFLIRSPHALAYCQQLRFQWQPQGEFVLLHRSWRGSKQSRELRSHCLLEHLHAQPTVFPVGDWIVVPMGAEKDPHLALRGPECELEVRYKREYEITLRRQGKVETLTFVCEAETLAALRDLAQRLGSA